MEVVFPVKLSGHDDCDQVIGQVAKLLAGVAFDTPTEAIDHLNNLTAQPNPSRAARASKKPRNMHKTRAWAYKLDEVTEWKKWTAQLGIKIKGLRAATGIGIYLHTDAVLDVPK